MSAPNPIAIFGSDLVAWWDFSDVSTILGSPVATYVTHVTDKSGNGHTLFGHGNPIWSSTAFHSSVGGVVFNNATGDALITESFSPFGTGTIGAVFAHCYNFTGSLVVGSSDNKRLISYKDDSDPDDYSSPHSAAFMVMDGSGTYLQGLRNNAHLSTVNTIVPYGTPGLEPQQGQNIRALSVFDGADHAFWIEDQPATSVASTGNFGGPGKIAIGNRVQSDSFGWKGAVTEVVVVKCVPTATQREQMRTWHVRHWPYFIVAEGDSLVDYDIGIGYPTLAMPNIPSFYICNRAIGGSDLYANGFPTSITSRASYIDSLIPADKFGQKYLLYAAVSNNLSAGDAAPMGAYLATRRLAGFDYTATSTVLSRDDPGQENDAVRAIYNPSLAPAWQATYGIDLVIPFAIDPIMGVNNAPLVHPEYFRDLVHYNAAGGARLQPFFSSALNTLIPPPFIYDGYARKKKRKPQKTRVDLDIQQERKLRALIKERMHAPPEVPPKVTKASVDYSPGTIRVRCGVCKYYSAHACKKVLGSINPNMWCRLFDRAR